MTHQLEGFEGQPFVDRVRYTSEVNDLIAAFIAERIRLPLMTGAQTVIIRTPDSEPLPRLDGTQALLEDG